MTTEDTIIQLRKEKLEKLRKLGVEAYPAKFERAQTVAETASMLGKKVKTAGKLFSLRTHGNIIFADLKDDTGKIQLFFKKDVIVSDQFKNIELLDVGDFIGVEGEVSKTVAGEISIVPTSYTLLSKSIRQLPDLWYGVKDVETRFRQRYLDLLLNPDVKKRFETRTKVIRAVRQYLDGANFWEVETPILQHLYGGANAKPFKTYFNALDANMYLRIAPELYLKRLIAGGYDRVYEIGKVFRNEGLDRTHSPEFTMLEWYESYADYHRMMDVGEDMLKHVAQEVLGTLKIKIEKNDIDLSGKWPRIRMVDILKEKLTINVENMNVKELIDHCTKNKINLIGGETKGQLIFTIFEHSIPKTLLSPTWIIDYPADVSPLAKAHENNPEWVQRFEGYIGGREISDGWSELTDPEMQRSRFKIDEKVVRADMEEAQHMDEDFIMAMEYGLPPLGGIGFGVDRLAMLFSNTWAIKEVVLFPTLRPDTDTSKLGTNITHKKTNDLVLIDPSVSEKWPSMKIGWAIMKNVKIQQKDEKLEKEKIKVLKALKNVTVEEIGKFPEIESYRKLYREMGVDWHSRRPSPEALLRRVAQGKGLYTVNTCVDSYNLVVMKNHISVGAFDLDKMTMPFTVNRAKSTDQIILIGEDKPTVIIEGAVCYYDKEGPFNQYFNYRDADRTKVTQSSKNIVINVDGVFNIDSDQVEKVLNETIAMVEKYCGGKLVDKGISLC